MYFEQVVRADMGCAAYLVGSASGEAAVVDPRIDMVDELLVSIEREKLRLRYIIETHNHADHVSGHHLLAQRTGAQIAVHERAGAAYFHRPLRDGEELTLGEVRLRVLHTPGHRPEHIALAVIDASRGPEPWLVLTGDSLFVGDVARPDLAVPGEEGAATLYHTLHDQLLSLPDGTLVYPGHVSGSLCGRVTSRMTGTTIGYERAYNPVLAIRDEGEFVRYATENLPVRPPNMARVVELNTAAEQEKPRRVAAISARRTARMISNGTLVLDVRAPERFAEHHLPGAISVQFGAAQFPNRVGLTVPADATTVVVGETTTQAQAAIASLAVIGYRNVLGYLSGGMTMWMRAGFAVETLQTIAASELRRQVSSRNLLIVDVREPSEWEEGHIGGSVNIPFYRVTEQLQASSAQPIAVVCATGHRSTVAASILQARGYAQIYNVAGGMAAWNQATAA